MEYIGNGFVRHSNGLFSIKVVSHIDRNTMSDDYRVYFTNGHHVFISKEEFTEFIEITKKYNENEKIISVIEDVFQFLIHKNSFEENKDSL